MLNMNGREKMSSMIESILKGMDVFPHPETGERVTALPVDAIEMVMIENIKTGLWTAEYARTTVNSVAKMARERGFEPSLCDHFQRNSEAMVKIVNWADDVYNGRAIDRDYRIAISSEGIFELVFTRTIGLA